MNSKSFSLTLFYLLAGWLLAAPIVEAQAGSRMSSRFLARGERGVLQIVSEEPHRVSGGPEIPEVSITPRGFGPIQRYDRGRGREFVTEFEVLSYAVGRHTIPGVEVLLNGTKTVTNPVDIVIFNPDELELQEVNVAGKPMRYATAIMATKPNPFEGESIPAEIKIYLPREFKETIADPGIPEYERDGVAAWRFDPSQSLNELNLLGRPYVSMAYTSTVTPLQTGPVIIGPATLRITSRQMIFDNFGPRSTFEETNLTIPALTLESRPLPPGAPKGFENAVGDFTIEARTTARRINEGDPLSVEVIVSGRGNLDTMNAPRLIDENGWKVYDATRVARGEERRLLDGTVTFQQFMRPLSLRSAVPPFRLVFFDPDLEEYKTLTTAPLALEVVPGSVGGGFGTASPPSAAGMPVERMTDILAIARPATLLVAPAAAVPMWLVHVFGGLLALILVFKAFWMRYAPRLRRDPVREQRQAELRELTRKRNAEDTVFLKSAGGFIERWLGEHPQPEIREILAERDAVCFRAEKPQIRLDRRRRDEMLRSIRRSATTIILAMAALVLTTAPARADDAAPADLPAQALSAYESANYQEAVRLWLEAGSYDQLSADVLYNIGNACYRMGSPGHAALYYRRALARAPGHQESRQNLRFIERKVGSITVKRPEYQYALAVVPLSGWKLGVWGGLWLTGLALLCFPASRPGARLRIFAICGLVAGPLLVATGALGWRYFPDDAEFAPLERQAVIVVPEAVLHADASRNAPEVIDAPPGSLCEIIRESGRWAYVSFATKTRGWVPMESIEKVIPDTPPTPPEIRKPKADGSSA